jgi:hypothetical protein
LQTTEPYVARVIGIVVVNPNEAYNTLGNGTTDYHIILYTMYEELNFMGHKKDQPLTMHLAAERGLIDEIKAMLENGWSFFFPMRFNL